MPRFFVAAFALALALAAGADGASSDLRLQSMDPHAYPNVVRTTLVFQGGRLNPSSVFASDPMPFADGRAVVRVNAAGGPVRRLRVGETSIRSSQSGPRLLIHFTSPPRRFKYFGYVFSKDRKQLALELWKSTPPRSPAPVGPDRCLVLQQWAIGAGSATVRGTERGLFEHMFLVRIRDRRGTVLATRGVSAVGGRWRAQISYHAANAQPGTLEAVDTSEADGSLVCLAEVQVRLHS